MTSISKLLIANRGEIACRIMRTAQSLGIKVVAVYSQADRTAPHVKMADEAVLIGEAPVAESYLNGAAILAAAAQTKADAIHPGYGFLSENADFAQSVAKAGLIFVGAPANAILQMGNKAAAKRLMQAAKVACVPGYEGENQDDAILLKEAEAIGFPLMVKAAAGGGGRGMRLVQEGAALANALATARSEAQNAFGSGELILEKAIIEPRHVEIQIFADAHGNTIHLGERDCSVQRRHQKVIEESPCPVMTADLRASMGAAAVAAARAINYCGAGTVEFLLDKSGAFYFLEMNTRLQVEHPVTEMVTGLDLVALQLRVAEGAPLGIAQEDVKLHGAAMEVRLYAEDPHNQFLPCTGTLGAFHQFVGAGVRFDSGVESGQEISPFYDPMLAKLITHGDTRAIALRRMNEALRETALFGLTTNRDFLIACTENERFAAGDFSTAFIAQEFGDSMARVAISPPELAALAVRHFQFDRMAAAARALCVPTALYHFTAGKTLTTPYRLECEGAIHDISISTKSPDCYQVHIGETQIQVQPQTTKDMKQILTIDGAPLTTHAAMIGDTLYATLGGRSVSCINTLHRPRAKESGGDARLILAPMHGRVMDVAAVVGAAVAAGERLVVVEAMKMQHEITAQMAGKVAEVAVAANQQVAAGDLLVRLEITEEQENQK